ncbi:MAG: outer membrane protein assembly factor BamA [Moraxella sp.]|nr:outer membrane protein assembly factor BamA [Moraxella sp.]
MRTPFFVTRTVSAAVVLIMSAQAVAAPVVVSAVDVVGLNRVTPESVLAILPKAGQTVTDEGLADSIKALYATEQFSNVQVDTTSGRLVYYVEERPIIAEINFEGNRLIPKEGLEEGLKQAGLAQGQVLKQATVHNIETELENQYILQGYYNSDIEVEQTSLDGNRVKLDIRFVEGKPAKVVDINILGNQEFSAEDIKDAMALKESSWNKLRRSDRYAQEKFAASLEAVRAMYLNAGFVNFEIENATLNIDEEKNNIFIEIKLSEGVRHNFGKTNFLGNPHYAKEELEKLVQYQEGGQYSQAQLDATGQAILAKFGDDGFYNAQLRPIRHINSQTRIVDVDYYIDPARPVYVRRINFNGNVKTKDEVLRREMRQLEGALASNQKIQLSRARLLRTGYFKNVVVETKPVPNSPDQIDVNFVVEEQPSGSSTIAAGYSQSGGITFQVDLSQNNFMGTGNKVNMAFIRSETRDTYSLGVTDPYFTVNGVSQGISGYYRKTKYDDKNISNYVMDSLGGSLTYGYPINEYQRISGGLNVDNTEIRGGRYMALSNIVKLLEDGGTADYSGDIASFNNDYTTYNAMLGWSYSNLDRPAFPTKGMSHEVDLTLGFGDATYQKVTYRGNAYYPLWKGTILRGYTRLGYGNDLPFYENFYAGGYGSVRGYDASSLGPQSQAFQYLANGQRTVRGEEVGGNALATFGTELILPTPFKGDWAEQIRPVIFFEGGQVFDTTDRADETVDLSSINSNLSGTVELIQKDDDLRYSAGLGMTWITPIGPISISYAVPIGDKENDLTEKVQFQIGSTF